MSRPCGKMASMHLGGHLQTLLVMAVLASVAFISRASLSRRRSVSMRSPEEIAQMVEFKNGWTPNFSAGKITPGLKKWWAELGHSNSSRTKRQVLDRVTRPEIRMLSNRQLRELGETLHLMMSTFPDPNSTLSEYHTFVAYHSFDQSPGAHNGLAFLPWHREYLYRFETALRQHNENVALPYWDNTLDRDLPDPRDSVLFSEYLMGNNDGVVTSGLVEEWPVAEVCRLSGQENLIRELMRTATQARDFLFPEELFDYVIDSPEFRYLACSADCTFENEHGGPHVMVGGQMSRVTCSPSDPIFWMHHAFIDSIWEDYRQKSQDPFDRENDYPADGLLVGFPEYAHQPEADMLPFDGFRNIDGLRNWYTDVAYDYSMWPSLIECRGNRDCNSRFLWCDRPRCRSKIRLGGNCAGLRNRACYRSRCVNDICQ